MKKRKRKIVVPDTPLSVRLRIPLLLLLGILVVSGIVMSNQSSGITTGSFPPTKSTYAMPSIDASLPRSGTVYVNAGDVGNGFIKWTNAATQSLDCQIANVDNPQISAGLSLLGQKRISIQVLTASPPTAWQSLIKDGIRIRPGSASSIYPLACVRDLGKSGEVFIATSTPAEKDIVAGYSSVIGSAGTKRLSDLIEEGFGKTKTTIPSSRLERQAVLSTPGQARHLLAQFISAPADRLVIVSSSFDDSTLASTFTIPAQNGTYIESVGEPTASPPHSHYCSTTGGNVMGSMGIIYDSNAKVLWAFIFSGHLNSAGLDTNHSLGIVLDQGDALDLAYGLEGQIKC